MSGYQYFRPGPPPAPQPGVVPLRPLGFGDVISGVINTLKRYVGPLYLPVLAATGGAVLVLTVYVLVAYRQLVDVYEKLVADKYYTPTDHEVVTLLTVTGAGLLVLLVCLAGLGVVGAATGTVVSRHAVLGKPVTARGVWTEARRHLGRIAALYLLLFGGAFLVLGTLIALPVLGAFALNSPAFGLLAVLFGTAGWVALLYVYVRLTLLVPVMVLEEAGLFASLSRAWRLNEGAWWRSLGIPYVVNLIASGAGQLVATPFVLVGFLVMMPFGADEQPPTLGAALAGVLLSLVGTLLSTAVALPLVPVSHALLYVDRRIRRERLDVTLAEAAGLWTTAPAPQPASTDGAGSADSTGDRGEAP